MNTVTDVLVDMFDLIDHKTRCSACSWRVLWDPAVALCRRQHDPAEEADR